MQVKNMKIICPTNGIKQNITSIKSIIWSIRSQSYEVSSQSTHIISNYLMWWKTCIGVTTQNMKVTRSPIFFIGISFTNGKSTCSFYRSHVLAIRGYPTSIAIFQTTIRVTHYDILQISCIDNKRASHFMEVFQTTIRITHYEYMKTWYSLECSGKSYTLKK